MKYLKTILPVVLLVMPLSLNAQWAVSPQVLISVPESDFANVAETGGGFGIKVERVMNIKRNGFGFRGDFGYITFGKKSDFLTDGFQVIPIESRNEGIRLTLGPQYRIGGRSLKAYVSAAGGVYFFSTNVSFTAGNFQGGIISGSRRENSNWALGWNGSVGLQYDIGLGPWLDVAFEYQTMYNLPGAVQDPEVEPADVTAHEYTVKVGVIFFLGR